MPATYFFVRAVLFITTPDRKIVLLKIRLAREFMRPVREKSKIPLELNNGKVREKTYETTIYKTSTFSQR
jgi:hypothetical protein